MEEEKTGSGRGWEEVMQCGGGWRTNRGREERGDEGGWVCGRVGGQERKGVKWK